MLPPKVRPFVLGYGFGSMRRGIQSLGLWQVDQLSFIWEVGAGRVVRNVGAKNALVV